MKTMTPKEFRESKKIHYAFYTIEQIDSYLKEYASYVLSVAAEKAEIDYGDEYEPILVNKESILNCLKD